MAAGIRLDLKAWLRLRQQRAATRLLFGLLGVACSKPLHDEQETGRAAVSAKSRAADEPRTAQLGVAQYPELASLDVNLPAVLEQTHSEAARPKGSEQHSQLPTLDTTQFEFGFPSPLPQELACGEKTLVRLLPRGFVSYQLATKERKVVAQAEHFYSATALIGFSTLLLGPQSTQRYYFGERSAEPFARTAALGPFSVFADNDATASYWVHYLRDNALYGFHLGAAEYDPLGIRRVELPAADGRLVYRTASGAVLYTSFAAGVTSQATPTRPVAWILGSERRVYDVADIAPQLVGVAAAKRTDRFWAFDLERGASLVEMARGRPVPQHYALNGKLVNFDVEADRVLFLTTAVNKSQVSKSAVRSFRLELWENGTRRFSEVVDATPSPVGGWFERNVPNGDVCVFPGRPWIAWGGRSAVTVWDYATRRVVFEDVD